MTDADIRRDIHPHVFSLLQATAARFRVVRHSDLAAPVRSPQDVAAALGYDVGRITKTLLLKVTGSPGLFIAVLSATFRADLQVLSDRFNASRCSVATPSELEQSLGYPRGGVSPFTSIALPVLLDVRLMQYDSVLVGSGRCGAEIDLSPGDLASLTNGEWLAFSQTAEQSGAGPATSAASRPSANRR